DVGQVRPSLGIRRVASGRVRQCGLGRSQDGRLRRRVRRGGQAVDAFARRLALRLRPVARQDHAGFRRQHRDGGGGQEKFPPGGKSAVFFNGPRGPHQCRSQRGGEQGKGGDLQIEI